MGIKTRRTIAVARELPEEPALDKDDPRRNAEHQRYEHSPHPRVDKRQVVHVHAIEAEHDRWNSQHKRDDGQALHGVIHAVVDDVAERVHGFVEQLRADFAHFGSLAKLNAHVIKQVFILFEHLDVFSRADLRQRCFHGTQRNGEVNQRLLQTQHADHLKIAHARTQLLLVFLELAVDNAQVCLVTLRDVKHPKEQHLRALLRFQLTRATRLKLGHRRVFLKRHRHDDLVFR